MFGAAVIIAIGWSWWTSAGGPQSKANDFLNPQPVPACMVVASGTAVSVSNCDLDEKWVQVWVNDVYKKINEK